MLLGKQAAGMIAAGAGEVRVNIDASGHDDHTSRVQGGYTLRHIRNHPAIFDADVSYFTIYTVRRVV
jgi:hypothetical protein